MKRIKAACLEQTLHFHLREELGHAEALKVVQTEAENYKAQLARKHIKHQIVEETTQADGSIILKVKKQYNGHDCGDYIS